MKIKIDNLSLISLREKAYEGKPYYFASILENGFVSSVSCSKEFFDKYKTDCRSGPVAISGQIAELGFYQGKSKIKLI